MKLSHIAQALACELHGDGDIEISGVAGLEHAGPAQLTFLANMKYAPKVRNTRAAPMHAGSQRSDVFHSVLLADWSASPVIVFCVRACRSVW